jgi:hypothetical protein
VLVASLGKKATTLTLLLLLLLRREQRVRFRASCARRGRSTKLPSNRRSASARGQCILLRLLPPRAAASRGSQCTIHSPGGLGRPGSHRTGRWVLLPAPPSLLRVFSCSSSSSAVSGPAPRRRRSGPASSSGGTRGCRRCSGGSTSRRSGPSRHVRALQVCFLIVFGGGGEA